MAWASSAFALLLLAVMAPAVPGVVARTKAVLVGRRGSPIWQLYADLWKLARRGVVYSVTTTGIFRVAPVLVVSTTLAAAALVPLDGRAPLIRFSGDVVMFAYLLALGRFTLVLASLDTGSSFEGMGASREVTFGTMVELGLFVAFAALAIAAHDWSLGGMLGVQRPAPLVAPASVLLAVGLFALTLAECARVPVDDPATHLELTMVHEVMVLDHSGPDLALILYASSLKLALFAALIVRVLVRLPGGWPGIASLLASLLLVGIAIGVVESVMARLRLPRVPLYIAGGSALALFGLILELR
jgi:formate hydrogenlyase subunit 4